MKKYLGILSILFAIFCVNPVHATPAELFGTTLIADLAEKISPAVVSIESVHYVKTGRFNGFGDPFFDRFFSHFFDDDFNGSNNVIPQKGTGSGVVISKDGYLLTNEHVISDADEIKVNFADGTSYKAKIVGKDRTNDLAVLKIEAKKNLSFLEMGDSDKVRVGEWVIAMGNPFGIGMTLTAGVVSAVNRDLSINKNSNYKNLIQTDASINPGNSGGALVNSNGLLIGINTAIMPSGQGIGFAIPVNRAKRIVGDLIKYGKVKKVSIGVSLQDITKELADYFEVPQEGVLVTSVSESSAASNSGLVPSDIILKIDGKKVNDVATYDHLMDKYSIGQSCDFEILRKNKKYNLKINIIENKASKNCLGIEVKKIDDSLIEKYGLVIDEGVVVVDLDQNSPAAEIGMKPGDVILQINSKNTLNVKGFDQACKGIKSGNKVIIRMVRGRRILNVLVVAD